MKPPSRVARRVVPLRRDFWLHSGAATLAQFFLRHPQIVLHFMSSEILVIDFTGDVVITLKDPSATFAVWGRHNERCAQDDSTSQINEIKRSSQVLQRLLDNERNSES
jgi:hypothetical protein